MFEQRRARMELEWKPHTKLKTLIWTPGLFYEYLANKQKIRLL